MQVLQDQNEMDGRSLGKTLHWRDIGGSRKTQKRNYTGEREQVESQVIEKPKV